MHFMYSERENLLKYSYCESWSEILYFQDKLDLGYAQSVLPKNIEKSEENYDENGKENFLEFKRNKVCIFKNIRLKLF